MTAPTERGFGRLIEAAKGVKAMFDWLERSTPTPAEAAEAAPPELGEACTRPQADGWRCVRRGPHAQCLLEEGIPHAPPSPAPR